VADEPLKLILELDSRIKGLLGLDSKLEGAGHAAGHAGKALHDMAKASDHEHESVHHLHHGLELFSQITLAEFAGHVMEKGLEMITEAVVELGHEMIKTIGDAQRLDRAFHILFSPDEAEELEEWIEKIQEHTRFSPETLKEFATNLKRVGATAEQIPDMLRAGLDLSELMGGDPKAALAQVSSFFETLTTRGEIAFRQLQNVGITKPELLKSLSEQTGDTIADVEKKLSAGKIKIDRLEATIFKAITEHTRSPLGAVGVVASKGLDAQIDRLKRVPEELFVAMSKSKASQPLADQFGALAKVLSPEGPIGSQILTGLTTVFSTIVDALGKVDVKELFEQISHWTSVAVTGVQLLAGAFGELMHILDLVGTFIGTALGAVYVEITNVVSGLGRMGEQLADFLFGILNPIYKLFEPIFTAFGQLPGQVWKAASDLGSYIWKGLKDGILGGIGHVTDAMGEMISGVLGKVTGMLGIHSPSRVLMEMGQMTGEGYAQGIGRSEARIDAAAGDTFQVDATPRAGARVLGGAVTVSMPITVNWTGGEGAEDDAKALAERIRDLLPGQLQAVFEQLGLEMGTT